MGRDCAQCGDYLTNSSFSRTQLSKGPGYSRCKDCIGNDYNGGQTYYTTYTCDQCYRTFDSSNELEMHMQVHRPKTIACPICGEERFRSGANAVQHVESGHCRGCRGKNFARQKIYEFASSKHQMNSYMTNTPMLTYGDQPYGAVPDFPYQCQQCNKSFRQLSQLMQHQDNKHRNTHMLGY